MISRFVWAILCFLFVLALSLSLSALNSNYEMDAKSFPTHWGPEPAVQTEDYRELPGGYGMGSSTKGNWIDENMHKDKTSDKEKGAAAHPLATEEESQGKGQGKGKGNYPLHWGSEPPMQTRDYRELPGGYGFGSGTVAKWIIENMQKDEMEKKEETTAAGADVDHKHPDSEGESESHEKGQGQGQGKYPLHWGEPPRMQTKDLRPLPGGYGRGSGTLARWIQEHLDLDSVARARDRAGTGEGEKKEVWGR